MQLPAGVLLFLSLRLPTNTSVLVFVGSRRDRNWRASVQHISLGTRTTEEEAARLYDEHVFEHLGVRGAAHRALTLVLTLSLCFKTC